MKTNILAFTIITLLTGSFSMTANAVKVVDQGNTKAVGHVTWQKKADINPQDLVNKAVPKNSTSLFFIRRYDKDTEQTSANIAVNDRFQVSLQPGNYSQVYSCAGINRLSVEATGLKTNDLLRDERPYTLEGGGKYFFYVDVNNQGKSSLQQISEESALKVLQNKKYQTHQISRVVPNCPKPTTTKIPLPTVVVTPAPVLIKPLPKPVPVLKEKVSIELEVLFDNDKSVIKPDYFSEVMKVAEFMNRYPNTHAVIEGHTDSKAGDSYNQRLSQSRADAVKLMLVTQYGISPDRLKTVGYGESQPRATNDTAVGRQQNRRVVAVIEENFR